MLLITCPNCGPRNETEFSHGGERDVVLPAFPLSDEAWADYLFMRENPAGPVDEWWFHRLGCRMWFALRRDTTTNELLS
jgi:heterotetrameric sarcosine oxidase delta subunit